MNKEQLVLDSQELEELCMLYGIPVGNITGALVVVGDGEYTSVRMTTSKQPWSTSAVYKDVSLWIEFYSSEEYFSRY